MLRKKVAGKIPKRREKMKQLIPNLKNYLANLTPAQLVFKVERTFRRFSPVSPKADKILSCLLTYVDYGDVCKPVTLSTTRITEDLNLKRASTYTALKELLLLGLIVYTSGKYEKEQALKERSKVFPDTQKTRSYNEVNAYNLLPAIAYGIVCDFLHANGVPYATLTNIALLFKKLAFENFDILLKQPLSELKAFLEEQPSIYLLPAFTLANIYGISDNPNSQEVYEIARELETLTIGALCKSSSGDCLISQSDCLNPNGDCLISQSDCLISQSDCLICDNQPNHIPPNKNTHTHTVEKNASAPLHEVSHDQLAKPSENQKVSSKEEQKRKEEQSDKQSDCLISQSRKVKLSDDVKEWFMDCLKRDGVRNPNALMRKMTDEEIRDTIKRHLDELIDNEEEYEFLKQHLPVEEIARYFLLSEEARIDFLKDKKLLIELQNYYLAKEYENLFRQVFSIIISKADKEIAKKVLANFIRSRYNGRAKKMKSLVEIFLRILKERKIIWEKQINGSIKIEADKEAFEKELPNLIQSLLLNFSQKV